MNTIVPFLTWFGPHFLRHLVDPLCTAPALPKPYPYPIAAATLLGQPHRSLLSTRPRCPTTPVPAPWILPWLMSSHHTERSSIGTSNRVISAHAHGTLGQRTALLVVLHSGCSCPDPHLSTKSRSPIMRAMIDPSKQRNRLPIHWLYHHRGLNHQIPFGRPSLIVFSPRTLHDTRTTSESLLVTQALVTFIGA